MSIVLQRTAVIIWGRDHRPFPDVIQRTSIDIAGATITDLEIGMILISLALMISLLDRGRKNPAGVRCAPRHRTRKWPG